MWRSALGPGGTISDLALGGAAEDRGGGGGGGAAGGVAGAGVEGPLCDAQAVASTARANRRRGISVLGFGASENGHDLGVFARDLEQLPSPLSHVRAPADELLPVCSARAKDAEVGDVLPVRRIWRGGRGGRLSGHKRGSGGTISRVLFTRWYEQMVISLG